MKWNTSLPIRCGASARFEFEYYARLGLSSARCDVGRRPFAIDDANVSTVAHESHSQAKAVRDTRVQPLIDLHADRTSFGATQSHFNFIYGSSAHVYRSILSVLFKYGLREWKFQFVMICTESWFRFVFTQYAQHRRHRSPATEMCCLEATKWQPIQLSYKSIIEIFLCHLWFSWNAVVAFRPYKCPINPSACFDCHHYTI